MLSAKFDHRRSAAVLLDQEMGMADAAGKTAADYAAGGDCLVLLGQESRCRDLFEAAQKGCEGCCRRLIGQAGQTRDIHLDSGGAKNRTALMVAAERGRTECVRVLMEREAGMRDSGGMSALMVAAGRGHEGCVELLVGKEAGMKDNEGKSALMIASEKGHVECVRVLVGREKGILDSSGKNALWHTMKTLDE